MPFKGCVERSQVGDAVVSHRFEQLDRGVHQVTIGIRRPVVGVDELADERAEAAPSLTR